MVRKVLLSCFIFFILVFTVSALTDVEVSAVSELVYSSNEGEFLLFVEIADENELDLRAESELSGELKEKAEFLDIELSGYSGLKLYNNFFSRFSWFFSNYITGFAGADYRIDDGNGGQECEPDCKGKKCGDDGCGGSCGECKSGEECKEGKCVKEECKSDCEGKKCGDDGCGGSCGICGKSLDCKGGKCVVDDSGDEEPQEEDTPGSTPSTITDTITVTEIVLEKCVGCYKENVWIGLCEKGVMIKPALIKEECKLGCEKEQCIEGGVESISSDLGVGDTVKVIKYKEGLVKGEFVDALVEGKPEEDKKEIKDLKKEDSKSAKKEEEKKEEKIKSVTTTLSVKELSKKMKKIVSDECIPMCKEKCGQPDGCGGFCPKDDINISGKCGNPPKDEELTPLQKATSPASDVIGGLLKILFG